jgi:hypothetical protein
MVCRECGSDALRREHRRGFLQMRLFPRLGFSLGMHQVQQGGAVPHAELGRVLSPAALLFAAHSSHARSS